MPERMLSFLVTPAGGGLMAGGLAFLGALVAHAYDPAAFGLVWCACLAAGVAVGYWLGQHVHEAAEVLIRAAHAAASPRAGAERDDDLQDVS